MSFNMREIQLTKGKVALVDDADFDWLNQWKWSAMTANQTFYAIRTDRSITPRVTVRMHRLILGLHKGDIRLADHKDHNGLNNQRENLRISNDSQNAANRNILPNSRSKYLGVTHRIDKRNGRNINYWQAQIRKDGRTNFLGYFPYTNDGEIEAAKAYDKAAINIHKDFANLNFK